MLGELVERFQYHKDVPMAGSELHMAELVNACSLYFVTCLTREGRDCRWIIDKNAKTLDQAQQSTSIASSRLFLVSHYLDSRPHLSLT